MFILFFLGLNIKTDLIGIDLGTQYLKIAQQTPSGEAIIVPNIQGKIPRSSAVAFKIHANCTSDKIYEVNPDDLEIRFGDSANAIIKNNPKNGIRFLPHAINRKNDSIIIESGQSRDFANVTDLLALYLKKELSQFEIPLQGVLITVPSYWSRLQRQHIKYACYIAGIEVQYLVDDFSALSCIYTATRGAKLQSTKDADGGGRHILFIDIGATSVKAYGQYYEYKTDHYLVNETVTKWSESLGTYYFAKALAQKRNISQKKAEKLIQRLESTKEIDEKLDELRDLIKNAFSIASKKIPIHEIQLIGGGSGLPFISQLVKDSSRFSIVQRDFNANEAIALGTVYFGMMLEETPSIPFTFCVKAPTANVFVKCNQTVHFCKKEEEYCRHGPMRFNGDGCNKMILYSDWESIPPGTSQVTQVIDMKSQPFKGHPDAYGKVTVEEQDQSVSSIQWCLKEKCVNVPFQADVELYKGAPFARNWTGQYMKAKRNAELRKKKLLEIETRLNKLKNFFDAEEETAKAEATIESTQSMKESYLRYKKDFDEHKIEKYTEEKIMVAIAILKAIMDSLEMK